MGYLLVNVQTKCTSCMCLKLIFTPFKCNMLIGLVNVGFKWHDNMALDFFGDQDLKKKCHLGFFS